jgi:hypothetical protein
MNPTDPQKKVIMQVCMTQAEADDLAKRAKEAGLSRSSFVRIAIGFAKNEKGLNFKTDNPRKKAKKD